MNGFHVYPYNVSKNGKVSKLHDIIDLDKENGKYKDEFDNINIDLNGGVGDITLSDNEINELFNDPNNEFLIENNVTMTRIFDEKVMLKIATNDDTGSANFKEDFKVIINYQNSKK